MKKIILLTAVVLSAFAANAKADGFVCRTLENDLRVNVYNHVMPQNGTRTGAIMILSNPAVAPGRGTIATFENINELLSNHGPTYVAKVDLRYRNSNRPGEYISGTRLGYVDSILLDVFFSYYNNINRGEILAGQLLITKRDGARIHRNVECARYLKQGNLY